MAPDNRNNILSILFIQGGAGEEYMQACLANTCWYVLRIYPCMLCPYMQACMRGTSWHVWRVHARMFCGMMQEGEKDFWFIEHTETVTAREMM